MKLLIILLKKLENLSALSMRLVKLTGKHSHAIHPKHLIKTKIWFIDYLKSSDKLLDLGCGSAQTTLRVAEQVKSVIGFDINQRSISIAIEDARKQNLRNIKFLLGNANKKLPFKNNYFDKVICSDVLEHLIKRNFALSEIHRILKNKGLLFLVTDNPNTSWKRLQKSVGLFYYADYDHKYEYSKKEIINLLESKNFRILSISTVTYDTPLKGLIDLIGGVSLGLYKKLRKWRQYMVKRHPADTTGYKIVAQKI